MESKNSLAAKKLDLVPPVPTTGEVNTSSNSGTGEGLALPKVGVDLPFKSLLEGFGIILTSLPEEVQIELDQLSVSIPYRTKRTYTLTWKHDEDVHALGLGAGVLTEEGNNPIPALDADGYYCTMQPKVGMGAEHGGFFCIDSVRRDLNFDITIKFRVKSLTDTAVYYGFFELDPTVNPLATTEHIGIVRDTGVDGNFYLSHSDGATLNQINLGAGDTGIHTLRLVSDEANSKFQYSFDGAALVDVTTNIPAAITSLMLFVEMVDLTEVGGKQWDLWYVDGVIDK